MTPTRMAELQHKVTAIIVQEAQHLVDAADFDVITQNDEEDEFIRAELRRQAESIEATHSARKRYGR